MTSNKKVQRAGVVRVAQQQLARESACTNYRFAGPACDESARPLWMRGVAAVMAVVMYFAPAVFLADETAHAAPIVDPRAPIPFQPTITHTSSGVPAINIPTPNGNGISVGQYQSFNVGPEGLVLNNSTVAGTPLLGGTLGANPNLNGRAATTIVNQVTSTGPAASLYGPLEVFGSPAAVVVASPNGLSVNGLSVTNVTNLTLTTGTPQFLTGVGGIATDFAHAGALAYNVTSGNISIDGPAGNDGAPGAGIEGTVGNIDLVGQSISIRAPLRADQRVNVVTGNQLVTPTSSDATGITYGTAANGAANTAAAIGKSIAVDASQYGSVTSGTVYIVSTAAGMGVNTQGPLSATAGNVVVNANGDVSVGQTFANQNVNLTSAGNTTINGTGLANQNYTVAANGDINAPGSVSAGQNVTMTAGGNLNAASVAANGAANLTAGQSMTIDSLTAHDIALQTTNGDLTVGGLSAPGTVSAKAGRDLTVNGAVQGGSTVALTGARNATVNGQVSGVGDTTIAAQTGSATVNGNALSNGALSVTAGQNAAVGGTVQAQGPVSIAAQAGSITGQGNVSSSQGAVDLNAGQAIALTGAVQSGSTVNATAGTNANFGGTVSAPGAVTIQAGQDTTLAGDVTSGGNLNVTSGGSTSVQGAAASVGDMTLAANGGSLSTSGNVVALGALNASGKQGVNLGGTVYSGGNASIGSSAGNVSVAGAVSTPGAVNISAGQDATVAGTVQSGQTTTIAAARDVSLNGGLAVSNTGNASVTAGRDINGTGALNVANDTTLNAGNNVAVSGAIQTGNNLSATAGQNLSVGATTVVGTSTLTATNGSATLTGDALSGGATTITAGTDVNAQGSVKSLGDLNANAKAGNLAVAGAVSTSGNANLNAGQNLTLNGQTTASNDANLAATNIAMQGVAVGGNLTATATNNLDTSAGQLNQPFSATAPALSVGGNATLSGANVTTANAVVGGTTRITGTQSITTGGTAAFKGDATLAGGTVLNVGTQMAAGNLNVSGTTVTNTGSLSSLQMATVAATNLNNSGTIYGPTANFNVSGATRNSGGLLATNALNLTTGGLNNANGLIYSGDVNNLTAAVGNTTVTVTGGNGSFDNTNGRILGQNVATLNLPNQTLDPSVASYGTVNGGNALNLSAQSVSNSGTWTLPGTAVTVSTTQGINNAGTINQGTGSLTLDGAVGNSGTVNGNDLTINGSLANAASGTVTANDAFTLNGSGTNAGTVQAANTLTISGSSYDNSGGTTKAGNSNSLPGSGNATINLSGNLGNAGGTLTATNDLSITANNVNNSAAAAVTTTTTTKTVDNAGLLTATPIGTETIYAIYNLGKDGGTLTLSQATLPATLGGLLSPGGEQPTNTTVWSTQVNRLTYQGWGDPSSPVATSGTVQFALVPTSNAPHGAIWVVVPPSTPVSGATTVQTLTLPTVTETTTTTGATVTSSIIAAGHDLNLTANTLNNQSGTVSAGHDANVNVRQLQNGGSSFTSTVTDTVDAASLNAFLTSLQALQKSGPIGVAGTANPDGTYQCTGGSCLVGTPTPPATYTISAPGTVPLKTVSSTATTQGAVGQILAGNNLNLSGGDLTNAGTLSAGNDVNVHAASFTNQGANVGSKTVTAGCASGVSNAGCSSLRTTNPNSETYSYQQTNSNVTAGHDIVIAANQVNNTYGNLVAVHDVVIGGAGTTAGNPTQASSVTNTSASIEAGNNVQINAANATNTIAAPVTVHQNYGSASPYTGCGQSCEAYIEVQSARPSTITANNNLSITAGVFSNTGSLVTALNNVTINASSSASSDNQYLHAYWTGNPAGIRTWGCQGSAATCQNLYGGAFSLGDAQAAPGLPSNVGMSDFVPATIQAGNSLSVNSPTLTNTGNVIGQSIALTGSQLVNGITNPNVFTPPPVVSGQVISLGPVSAPAGVSTAINAFGRVVDANGQLTSVTGSAGLPPNTPIGTQTVGKPVAPIVTQANTPLSATVKTISGQTTTVTYLTNNPAAQVIDTISSASLIANLPANLQPGNVPFYYDPYTENQQIEQAALQATGKSSFYSTTSASDSTSQASIANQDKAALYGAALEYAKDHNIALGTQLSDAQLAMVDHPMLWYVEQSVPEPGCSTTGGASCPTVQALMPEVLLPKNYAVVNADGEITGTNVTLNYANSILNTGTVTAQNLTVNTNSLTNEQRSTNVGTIYQTGQDGVLLQTTGTVAQQGGFMSAANYQLNAQSIAQIGGALQQVNADGSVNQAATQQMLSDLKTKLGGNFTQQSVSDNLHTDVVDGDAWYDQLFMTAVITGLAIMTGMAASAAIGAMASAASGTTFAAAVPATTTTMTVGTTTVTTTTAAVGAGTANLALSAGFAGMMSSTMNQLNSGGSFSVGKMLETGGVAALTAGLTNGITFGNGSVGWSWSASPNSLASLAGVQSVGNTLVPQAGAATGSLPTTIAAIAAESVLQATVQTALQGGSFLTNLRNSAAANAAASIAYTIGNLNQSGDLTGVAYVAAHAALGCAAGAATGQGCGGGAIGGAVSAALVPDVLRVIDPSGAALDQGQMAMLAAISALAGGGFAGLAGQNATAGAAAAQNEALNNDGGSPTHTAGAVKNGGALSAVAEMILTAMMPWKSQTGQTYMQPVTSTVNGVGSQVQANYGNKSQPPADANNQLLGNDNNTSGTAGAIVTPPTLICIPGGGCVMMVPLVSSGSTVASGTAPLLSDSNSTNGTGTSGNSGISPDPGKTAVYVSVAPDGAVQYVGITDNIDARAAAHMSQKGISIDAIPGLENISRADARAVEQVLIEYNGLGKNGGALLNKINSISTSNPIYANSLSRGMGILKSIGYKGF
ncbi:filamentous hemagglutinin N-terminal domain-containing protein [Burkholderia ambifaria]|uniref:two-partner secretion domain-containing protein n=1 Tax=Burkholderia ambifaria TaxID=152480 RepID=UPI001E46B15A|nr:filamentous hemagglutinin N-terminal domain-containing protein [Burkholderia ambifaria]UEP24006.1 filamentous hemagglutinin N-terminal domain-containing protein [Burkholderia ambifaria]